MSDFEIAKREEVFFKLRDGGNWDLKIDRHGRKILWTAYEQKESKYGWNIHRKYGNSDKVENLEAVHYDTHKELHNE